MDNNEKGKGLNISCSVFLFKKQRRFMNDTMRQLLYDKHNNIIMFFSIVQDRILLWID